MPFVAWNTSGYATRSRSSSVKPPDQVRPSSSEMNAVSRSRRLPFTTPGARPFFTKRSAPLDNRSSAKRAITCFSSAGGDGFVQVHAPSRDSLSISPCPVRMSIQSEPSRRSTAMCSA